MIDRCTHQVLELAVSLCCFRRWGWKNKVNIWNLLLMFAHANLGRDFLNKFRDLKFLSLELFPSRLSSLFIRHYIHRCFLFVSLVASTDCHVPSLNSWFMIFSSFYAYLLNGMCGTEYFNLALFSEHRTDWPSWRKWKHWMYFENTIFLRLSKIVFFTFFFFLKCVEAQNPRRRASLLSLYWMAPQMVSDTFKTVSTAEVIYIFFRLEFQSPKSGSFNLWTLEEASAWAWLGPQSSLAAPSEVKKNFSGYIFCIIVNVIDMTVTVLTLMTVKRILVTVGELS